MKVHENWIALKATIQPEKEKTVPSEHKLEQKKKKTRVRVAYGHVCNPEHDIYNSKSKCVIVLFF